MTNVPIMIELLKGTKKTLLLVREIEKVEGETKFYFDEKPSIDDFKNTFIRYAGKTYTIIRQENETPFASAFGGSEIEGNVLVTKRGVRK